MTRPPAQARPMRVHFVVPAPEGPIVSAPEGNGSIGVPAGKRFVVACDPSISLSEWDRGTGEPYAVHCEACKATEIYRTLYRPRPGREGASMTEDAGGCCG